MRLLQVNDPHLSDKAPMRRTPAYTEEMFEKLDEIRDMAGKYAIDAIVLPGDLFHQKTAMRVSYGLTMRALKWVDSLEKPLLVLPGNHDLSDNNPASLIRQPLGMLAFLPNVSFLGRTPVEFMGYNWFGVPGVMTEMGLDRFLPKTDWKTTIIVAHAPIVQDDKPYPYEVIRAADIAGRSFLVLYGHVHVPVDPHIFQKHMPYGEAWTKFVNPGAISRGTIGTDDLNRIPQVAIIEAHPTQAHVEYVPLKCAKPVDQVFLMEDVKQEKQHALSVDAFLTSLVGAKVSVVSRESLAKAIDESEAPPDIRELAKAVLEETN